MPTPPSSRGRQTLILATRLLIQACNLTGQKWGLLCFGRDTPRRIARLAVPLLVKSNKVNGSLLRWCCFDSQRRSATCPCIDLLKVNMSKMKRGLFVYRRAEMLRLHQPIHRSRDSRTVRTEQSTTKTTRMLCNFSSSQKSIAFPTSNLLAKLYIQTIANSEGRNGSKLHYR